jgi:hypothetical protein
VSAHPTILDVHALEIAERARVVLEMCKKTHDLDERLAYVELAFMPPPGVDHAMIEFQEEPGGQFMLDLGWRRDGAAVAGAPRREGVAGRARRDPGRCRKHHAASAERGHPRAA